MGDTKFANRVKLLRVMNGDLTQAQLAEKVGVTRQTIIAIESAKYLPSLEVAFKISRAFGSTIEEVFQYED